MPEDLHRDARMHVEGGQQRAAGLAGTVPGDPRHVSLDETAIEAAIEAAGLHRHAAANLRSDRGTCQDDRAEQRLIGLGRNWQSEQADTPRSPVLVPGVPAFPRSVLVARQIVEAEAAEQPAHG